MRDLAAACCHAEKARLADAAIAGTHASSSGGGGGDEPVAESRTSSANSMARSEEAALAPWQPVSAVDKADLLPLPGLFSGVAAAVDEACQVHTPLPMIQPKPRMLSLTDNRVVPLLSGDAVALAAGGLAARGMRAASRPISMAGSDGLLLPPALINSSALQAMASDGVEGEAVRRVRGMQLAFQAIVDDQAQHN